MLDAHVSIDARIMNSSNNNANTGGEYIIIHYHSMDTVGIGWHRLASVGLWQWKINPCYSDKGLKLRHHGPLFNRRKRCTFFLITRVQDGGKLDGVQVETWYPGISWLMIRWVMVTTAGDLPIRETAAWEKHSKTSAPWGCKPRKNIIGNIS